MPISLCNYLYKTTTKIIALRIKESSQTIFTEKFGTHNGGQIHGAIGGAREGLQTTKTKKMAIAVVKLDLSNAYDKESWMYLRLIYFSIYKK